MALGYCGYFQAAEVDERVARSAEPARQLRETHGATLDDADRAAVRGLALLKDGKPTDAASLLKRAVAGHPGNVEFRLGLCAALGALGQTKESLGEWREILRIRPDDAMALNAVAWILATSPDAALRNGEEAVLRAKFAVEFGPSMNPQFLDTLAAAYAEAGQFAKAVKTAEQAQAAARRVGDGPLGGRIAARLDLYRAGKPFREAAGK
jgi:tetratricopeptide (TPR) repeat protein